MQCLSTNAEEDRISRELNEYMQVYDNGRQDLLEEQAAERAGGKHG